MNQALKSLSEQNNGIQAKCLDKNKFIRYNLYLFIGLICWALSQTVIAESKKTLVFGVLPIVSTEKLVARFGPMADYLSEKIGMPVRLETAPDFETFMQRTNTEKRYDLIFTAPHLYYIAQRQAGYKVIVRVAAPDMKAIIVVPKNSKIKTLDDLKGKKLSTTDSIALATLMIKAHLKKAGINPSKDLSLVHTPSHNASLISAYKGITDAGSLMLPPFKRAKKEIQQSVRVLSVTEGSPHMPFAIAASLNKSIVNKLKSSFLQLKSSEKGRALLKHLRWPGFVAVNPQEYDKLKWAVEQLK